MSGIRTLRIDIEDDSHDGDLIGLIRIEHAARTTQVFRVCNDRDIGYLYFHDGQIIHATTRELHGEQALLAILEWRDGSFDPCEIEVSTARTVHADLDDVLSRAGAGERMSRKEEESVRPVPPPARQSMVMPPPGAPRAVTQRKGPGGEPPEGVMSDQDCEIAVRMTGDGRITHSKGAAEDLADVAAYVARLGQLGAEALGMDQLIALECSSDKETFIIYRTDAGELVALKPSKGAALHALRDELSL